MFQFPDPLALGLRFLQTAEVDRFVKWEKRERPYPWTAVHFAETLASPVARTLVMDHAGAAVGYAVVQVVKEEAYLLNFMVDLHHRRKRWGENLLRKVIIWSGSAGAVEMCLDVDPRNAGAVALYEKIGFKTIARRTAAYPNGEEALVMRRKL